MPDIYDISFDQKAVELLPPDKRGIRNVQWVKALLGQLQYLRNKTLGDYRTGATYPTWVASTYNEGDLVIYSQSVYQSLVDNNTAVPIDANKWAVYQQNFLGVNSRVKYNHQKLVLEYALNERFGTSYRQPPLVSDIYITKNAKPNNVFVVGGDDNSSSSVYQSPTTEVIINAYAFGSFFNFTINIPVAVYTGLSGDANTREKIVRGFVDQYNTIGTYYNIQTY